MFLILDGLGTSHLVTSGLVSRVPSGGVPGGVPGGTTGGGVVTRGLGSGRLITGGLGSAGAVTPPTPHAGILWPTPGYFTSYLTGLATSYFPGSSLAYATVGGIIVLPGTFIAAVRRALLSDDVLKTTLRGGAWHREAPRGVPRPYAIYNLQTDSRINSSYKSFVEQGKFRLTVYSSRDLTSRTAANRAVDVLTDQVMTWDLYSGRLMYFSLNTPLSSDVSPDGSGGARVYAASRVMDFAYQGVETGG
jgi:hypothetical protein